MYTPHTFRTGAGAYARVGVETGVMSATPHQLICMLFDGAKMAIGMARHHMAQRDIEAKGNSISRAVNIVENGLKAALDAKAAGPAGEELAGNLTALYDYIIQRLLFANLRNDARALDEADGLLDNIASAWREIDAGPARA
ncbi:flagellar export chaperone FliS [Variovorax sp. J22R24]|uniref:flagellar export chaperone FliS n=1 Tax=Variovorax gracilis TaxID=3053502 RepID=UPI002577F81C|nr:flagellar export chaperone FliS [Variovorax sp. J22R24]MDM0104344.1 flagellar export chaperone FliS [Variovorax sp. J22R24]